MITIVLDVVLALVLVSALVVGLRRGLLASAGALVGLVLGGLAAWWLVPVVGRLLPSDVSRAWATLAIIALLLFGGAALGAAVGGALRRGVDRIKLRGIDRALGGVANVVVVALALSLTGQAVATTGIPFVSSAVGSSVVLRTIDDLTPRPVDEALAQVRSVVIDDGLPQFGALFDTLPVGPTAAPVDLDDPALSASAQSVARIAGTAYSCGRSLTGTGFVIAEDRLVTNAHVVAGVDAPVVELPGRPAREGRVVYFDATADLAVIAVDALDASPIGLAPNLAIGGAGVVQGYPYGGPFTMGTASVRSVGTVLVPDIYGQGDNPRETYALTAIVRPGNSGGPVLDAAGKVAGVVFARADDGSDIGYAMTTTPLAPVVAAAPGLSDAVATGACVG
ncbi:MarP family serine protease [Microbacterium sp. cx-55]|uniref:MarP family serine protease n=1 Tax=unclassified Microbacterium TaxID=2609290 RepID=UPI001CBD2DE4|nr:MULTISPECIES: MarP family serine protease [unclassified Microbacterium]MBZ4485877.1 MarP family serine protease [Microbacterium sp. cx-55]MCC4906837.1 MarP family serine protease [Microbacterium sp. cx-59]UGB34246.1 MarP family serine protease [Microbacterium sp. cx-55]